MDIIEATTPDAQAQIIEKLSERDARPSRAGEMREDVAVLVRSPDPTERYVFRGGFNLAFQLQEHWAYWAGANPGHVQRYNSNMETWIDDETGELPGSAYGDRLRNTAGHDQLDRALDMLAKSPDTRRALMAVNQPAVEDYGSNDVACTAYLHPLLRDGELHMVAALRSQDMYWGYPYDTANNQFIQELMAAHLGVDVGEYWHLMDSCHYYTEHETKALRVAEAYEAASGRDVPAEHDPGEQFAMLTAGLEAARAGDVPAEIPGLKGFWKDWIALVAAYEMHRFHDEPGVAAELAGHIGSWDWYRWLQRRLE